MTRAKPPEAFPFKVTWERVGGEISSHSTPATWATLDFGDGWKVQITPTALTITSKPAWPEPYYLRGPSYKTNLTIPLADGE